MTATIIYICKNALKIRVFTVFFCIIITYTTSAAPTLPVLRVHSGSTASMEITLDLVKGSKFQLFALDDPPRLVIDIPHVHHTLAVPSSQWRGTCIQSLRQGHHVQGDYLRVVLDLCRPLSFSTEKVSLNGLVEQWHVRLTPRSKGSQGVKKSLPPTKSTPLYPAVSLPYTQQQRKVVVVIDPGHGGKDPGAIGPRGIQEKNVVMAIARDLYQLVQKEPGMTAVMTRDGDYYLTLRERLQKARRNRADIFVAIHADIFKYTRSQGSSVYALSLKGATSEAARWLAAKDNYSELGSVDLHGKDDVLRSVLIDLSQKATITSSLHLGSALLHEMGLLGPLHSGKVEQARFVVLKSPDIPSVLVETGFLSNPIEVKKLTSRGYQQQLAQSIMRGLREYFYDNPPSGTWIAAHIR